MTRRCDIYYLSTSWKAWQVRHIIGQVWCFSNLDSFFRYLRRISFSICRIRLEFPLTYKPYIGLVDNGASCVVTLEGPCAVVHSICVGRLRWLLSGNRGTIHISCTVAWSQCCDGCWKLLTCCLTLEAVTCLVLVSFKGPLTYKPYISLVNNGASCIITLEGPCTVVYSVCVSGLGWLLSRNSITIFISCTVTWKQRGDTC